MSISNEEIAEVIEDGADYLEKFGWHQGDLWGPYRSYEAERPSACMMGALTGGILENEAHKHIPMGLVVAKFIEITHIPSMSVYNDVVATDVQEVLDLMREVVKKIRTEA